MGVEPVIDAPAGVVDTAGERLLVVADYHAGIETVLRVEGVELDSRADERRGRLISLIEQTDPDRLVVLGDLVHAIGEPWEAERRELRALVEALSVPVTVVKGNHDGDVEAVLAELGHEIDVTSAGGIRLGPVAFAHGHTWPDLDLLGADVLCTGHEHPLVRLADEVGGGRVERVWLRGDLDPTAFEAEAGPAELVVFPAFNDLSGGTTVNVEGQAFLSPFLPEGLVDGEAYLLDGTRLGNYRTV